MVMPPPPGARRAVLVGAAPSRCGSSTRPSSSTAAMAPRYAEIIEALAPWMLRFVIPGLAELVAGIAQRCRHLFLEIELVLDDVWLAVPEAVCGTRRTRSSSASHPVCADSPRLCAGFIGPVNREDDGGRALARRVLRGLTAVEARGRDADPLLDVAAIEATVERTPLGAASSRHDSAHVLSAETRVCGPTVAHTSPRRLAQPCGAGFLLRLKAPGNEALRRR